MRLSTFSISSVIHKTTDGEFVLPYSGEVSSGGNFIADAEHPSDSTLFSFLSQRRRSGETYHPHRDSQFRCDDECPFLEGGILRFKQSSLHSRFPRL